MPGSTRSSTNRVLVAAITLVLVCGALLVLSNRSTSEPLTVSITPLAGQQVLVPQSLQSQDPVDEIAIYPVRDYRPNQIEVPRSRPQQSRTVRVAMLQPTAQASPPEVPVIDDGFFEEYEASLDIGEAPVAVDEESAEAKESDADAEPIDMTQSESVPVPKFEPQTVLQQQIERAEIESALTDMRTEISRITELELGQARAEQLERIDQLERQVDQLRTAQENLQPVRTKIDSGPVDSISNGPEMLDFSNDAPKLEVYEPIELRQNTSVVDEPIKVDIPIRIEAPVRIEVPTKIDIPVEVDQSHTDIEPFRAGRPMTVPESVLVPERIEYPPPEMESPDPTTTEATPATPMPRAEFLPPQSPVPLSQPATNPQYRPFSNSLGRTRFSACALLLNRLRFKRSAPCRYCGKVH